MKKKYEKPVLYNLFGGEIREGKGQDSIDGWGGGGGEWGGARSCKNGNGNINGRCINGNYATSDQCINGNHARTRCWNGNQVRPS